MFYSNNSFILIYVIVKKESAKSTSQINFAFSNCFAVCRPDFFLRQWSNKGLPPPPPLDIFSKAREQWFLRSISLSCDPIPWIIYRHELLSHSFSDANNKNRFFPILPRFKRDILSRVIQTTFGQISEFRFTSVSHSTIHLFRLF